MVERAYLVEDGNQQRQPRGHETAAVGEVAGLPSPPSAAR